jgi:hypothetical protein
MACTSESKPSFVPSNRFRLRIDSITNIDLFILLSFMFEMLPWLSKLNVELESAQICAFWLFQFD